MAAQSMRRKRLRLRRWMMMGIDTRKAAAQAMAPWMKKEVMPGSSFRPETAIGPRGP